MFKTGRLVIDTTTGKLVEETEQDHITIGVLPLGTEDLDQVQYRRVVRSKFTLKKINAIFKVSANYIKDPFGTIIWPKDWLLHVLPETATEQWKYIIVQKEPTMSTDEAADSHYEGQTQLMLTGIPESCSATCLKAFILYGLLDEFDNVIDGQAMIDLIVKKQQLLETRSAEIPRIQLEGTKQQQLEMRKNIASIMEKQTTKLQDQLAKAQRRLHQRKRVVLTEPITVERVDEGQGDAQPREQPQDSSMLHERLVQWVVRCPSPRGDEILSALLDKSNWNEIRLFPPPSSMKDLETRKKRGEIPDALLPAFERLEPHCTTLNDRDITMALSALDDNSVVEINMKTLRAHRVRHGRGMYLTASTDVKASDFHISSIQSLYQGQWENGSRVDTSGRAVEYTNAGVYRGSFQRDARYSTKQVPPHHHDHHHDQLVYGAGHAWVGAFRPAKGTKYEWSRPEPSVKSSSDYYPRSLFTSVNYTKVNTVRKKKKKTSEKKKDQNTCVVRFEQGLEHGFGRLQFADGGLYEGEMDQGLISGPGRYVSSTGIIQEGTFVRGQLHGPSGCSIRDHNVSYREGAFVRGQMHGRGHCSIQTDAWTWHYEGSFDSDVRSGYGATKWFTRETGLVADYRGLWHENLRHGLGTFEYRHETKCRPSRPPRFDYRYQGQFFDGLTTTRQCHLALHADAHRDHLPFTIHFRGSVSSLMQQQQKHDRRKHQHLKKHPKNHHHPARLQTVMNYIIRERKMERQVERRIVEQHERESRYGRTKEYENLSLYYTLLDKKFDRWAVETRRKVLESTLSETAQLERREARKQGEEAEDRTRLMKAGRLGLDMRERFLDQFETYIDRTPLSVLDQISSPVVS